MCLSDPFAVCATLEVFAKFIANIVSYAPETCQLPDAVCASSVTWAHGSLLLLPSHLPAGDLLGRSFPAWLASIGLDEVCLDATACASMEVLWSKARQATQLQVGHA